VIGQNIQAARLAWSEKHGEYMSFDRLARETGITKTALVWIETGVTKTPRLGTLMAIADVLGVSVDQLLGRKPMKGATKVRATTEAPAGDELAVIEPDNGQEQQRPAGRRSARRKRGAG
jgi:transcriptional regulator with XRE-family HTH domain